MDKIFEQTHHKMKCMNDQPTDEKMLRATSLQEN